MALVDPPISAVRAAVTLAISEDLTPLGDLTSAVLPPETTASGQFVARTKGVIAGRACVDETFLQVDPAIVCSWLVDEGESVAAGAALADVSGPLASVLTAERTALNFLGHLSGVATLTRAFVDAAGPHLRVWDTRKTTPGLRTLEKAAVRAGGGVNHRGNLSDWVMFKDNHLSALGIDEAVRRARAAWPGRLVHVEADRIEQVEEALTAGADALLLDNMSPDEVIACVAVADEHAATHGTKRALMEISGGITLESVRRYAATGADVVSSGSLTNSAPVLDIGLDLRTA